MSRIVKFPLYSRMWGKYDFDKLIKEHMDGELFFWVSSRGVIVAPIEDEDVLFDHVRYGGILMSVPGDSSGPGLVKMYNQYRVPSPQEEKRWIKYLRWKLKMEEEVKVKQARYIPKRKKKPRRQGPVIIIDDREI